LREVIIYSATGFGLRVEAEREEELRTRLFEAAQELRSAIDY
jgi:hypothetical protein